MRSGEGDLEQRVNFDGEMLQDGLALVHSSKNPFRTLCSANIEMSGSVATRRWRRPSRNIRFNAASSRLTVAGATFSFRRSVL